MVSSRWKSLAALVLASAGLGGFAAFAEEQAAETGQPIVVRARLVAQDGEVVPLEGFTADVAEEASPYWIGVQLEPPTDILKQHLHLEGGMVVVHVFEDGPAAKAGLKANDIILKAGDGYIKEPGDLLEIVGAAKENELTLVLIRSGKEQTIKVVPAQRRQEGKFQIITEASLEGEKVVQTLDAALHAYRGAGGADPTINVIRVRPGVVTSATLGALKLPKDVSVVITKMGNQPTKIVVKKGDREYQAMGDQINQLPEEVRGYVQLVRSGAETAMLKEDTVRTPLVPYVATLGGEKVYRYVAEVKLADENSKLDRILKIVSQKEDSSVSALRKEVQQLREELEELEELRKEKK